MNETDRLRKEQVKRARYEAELAQRRFLRVNPDNRLLADSGSRLEREASRSQEAQQECERRHQKDRVVIDEELRARLNTLTTDFPRLWRDPNTPDRERKRLARLLLEDVTLIKRKQSWSTFALPEALQERWSCLSRSEPT